MKAILTTDLLMKFVFHKELEGVTAFYSSNQSVVAERRWRSVGNMAKCLVKQINLPNLF